MTWSANFKNFAKNLLNDKILQRNNITLQQKENIPNNISEPININPQNNFCKKINNSMMHQILPLIFINNQIMHSYPSKWSASFDKVYYKILAIGESNSNLLIINEINSILKSLNLPETKYIYRYQAVNFRSALMLVISEDQYNNIILKVQDHYAQSSNKNIINSLNQVFHTSCIITENAIMPKKEWRDNLYNNHKFSDIGISYR